MIGGTLYYFFCYSLCVRVRVHVNEIVTMPDINEKQSYLPLSVLRRLKETSDVQMYKCNEN